ncbi:UNVERIFIED_CONTAM: hypothetical protein GTU68_058277 [Idotea baltica]|nr:hypothetical protein [Idotea baltica]
MQLIPSIPSRDRGLTWDCKMCRLWRRKLSPATHVVPTRGNYNCSNAISVNVKARIC